MPQLTLQQAFVLAQRNLHAGRLPEAEQICRQILLQDRLHAGSIHLRGIIASRLGREDVAVRLIGQAIALEPHNAQAYSDLGIALSKSARFDEAVAAYRQAIALRPGYPEAYNNLGITMNLHGRTADALDAFRKAIALQPQFADAHTNLGMALHATGLFDEAVAAYRGALAADPEYARAHFNLGLTLLTQGNFQQGLPDYEWRWKCNDNPPRQFAQPRWNGQPLEGRTILLYAEQGFGDALQFVRYAPLVRGRGGRVVLECHRELSRLLTPVDGVDQCVARGEPSPVFDVHFPLLSLPLAMGTTLETIPAPVPYIRADAAETNKWAHRLDREKAGLKVGLAWAGNPAFNNDGPRSPRQLALLSPLAGVENVHFYSLQKGEAGKQAKSPPAGMRVIDWTEDLRDFSDTAALLANLDLVITSDTAVAHLAGAMAKPLWVMLPFIPDWRRLLQRADCPWYPTARLFRQPALGDWNTVAQQVAEALGELLAATYAGPPRNA